MHGILYIVHYRVNYQELESEWEHQQGEEHVLRNQLKRLTDDLRRVNRQLEKRQKEKGNLEEKIGARG